MNINEGTLRPMEEADLPLVLEWRNSQRIRSCMFTDHLIGLEEHRRWFGSLDPEYQASLIFELYDKPCGVVNITQIDHQNERCSWGFYIGAGDAPRGAGLLMGFLAMDNIFFSRQMRKLCSEALVSNPASIAYHHRLGFEDEGLLRAHILKAGIVEDVQVMALFRDKWASHRAAVQGAIELY